MMNAGDIFHSLQIVLMQYITVRTIVQAGYSKHADVQEGLQNVTEISALLNMKNYMP